MTAAFVIFLIVAVIAVAAAAGMLLSTNAVHSAMYLILNFMCVAFFYLMLNAPFLAMAQVAVYAGAIMVLFLFVIMLLGDERLPFTEAPLTPWQLPLAFVLTAAFQITVIVALATGQVSASIQPTSPLAAAAADRLALAIDKARLFEQTQRQAAREQALNDIVRAIQAEGEIENILSVALTSLGQALGAARGAIRLGKPAGSPHRREGR